MWALPPGVGTMLSVEVPKGEGCKQEREQHPSGAHLPPRTPPPHTGAAPRAQQPRPQALGRSLTCPPNSSDSPLGQGSTAPCQPIATMRRPGPQPDRAGPWPHSQPETYTGLSQPGGGGRGVLHSIKTIPLT
ncbi:hypothetical protein KIL84_008975 [Mauremys mutica]|uniref:Uncharacterized protein n=1 Tax=Mauremys mutica TaxID=74926 RepID=A0A9D3XGI2_9SAUR|nr:hypothetical protein KIL84_008975 [Mauremys mutica]